MGENVVSKMLLVGQAPGIKEPELKRPFAWTAGKTMFKWFNEHWGVDEATFRSRVYMAAVCRCYPGKAPKSGDRVPDATEIENCREWLRTEVEICQPSLVLAVGKLAIKQFIEFDKLKEVVGQVIPMEYAGVKLDILPLPHPSGASTWHRMEPGKSLLMDALAQAKKHPAFKATFQ